ncbi:fimbrial protein [Citrobacter freundii complex sp. CFNIH2]|uniref:fimbrial protein n=1 Tax=Citrobacter freundii complex sp. CFNIH2 TaxID=2066049 RepID=UPI001652684E|nr:hypothetical protein [Citrobacter freundii complex sp. CFNIH2]
MYRLRFVLLFFFLHVTSVFATVINCEPSTASGGNNYDQWSEIHIPFELQSSNLTITLGNNIPDWQVLYSVHADIGMSTATCSSGHNNMYYTLLTQAQPVGTISGSAIYSTNVSGIGMSISASQVNNAAIKSYPSTVYYAPTTLGYGFWADVKLWKIPGEIPMNSGPITVTGLEAAVIYMYSGTTYTSSHADRIASDKAAYLSSSRILTVTMMFQPGTCNIEGDNVNVNMGEYDGVGSHSNWKDASFKLICPDGMGYNGAANSGNGYSYPYNLDPKASITKNNKKNGRVQISIVPYITPIDPNRGIIALDGTGAQGYGIQLAWGDYSTQNSEEPLNPVILNSYIDANKLNAGFGAGDTDIGGNGFNGTDNTIKMAARYIRTTGDTQPGPANAVVQVISNYQ